MDVKFFGTCLKPRGKAVGAVGPSWPRCQGRGVLQGWSGGAVRPGWKSGGERLRLGVLRSCRAYWREQVGVYGLHFWPLSIH